MPKKVVSDLYKIGVALLIAMVVVTIWAVVDPQFRDKLSNLAAEQLSEWIGSRPIVTELRSELEKSQSHILVGQMDTYFKQTAKGRRRARQIIPEPFFVHSDLTTGVQLADLIAYITSWGFRIRGLDEPARVELAPYVDAICQLRHRSTREINGNPNFQIWSFTAINDLGYGEEE